jgi:hypothetical protein
MTAISDHALHEHSSESAGAIHITASALSPPTNTARLRKARGSVGSRGWWLHSTAARTVQSRGGASRPPLRTIWRRPPERELVPRRSYGCGRRQGHRRCRVRCQAGVREAGAQPPASDEQRPRRTDSCGDCSARGSSTLLAGDRCARWSSAPKPGTARTRCSHLGRERKRRLSGPDAAALSAGLRLPKEPP